MILVLHPSAFDVIPRIEWERYFPGVEIVSTTRILK